MGVVLGTPQSRLSGIRVRPNIRPLSGKTGTLQSRGGGGGAAGLGYRVTAAFIG